MSESIHNTLDALTVRSDGTTVLKPCRDIVLYWKGSVFDRTEGIVDFYRRSLPLLKQRARFYRTETMRAAQRLKPDSLDLLPFWFQGTQTRRQVYMLYLESGERADEPSDAAFCLHAAEGGEVGKGFVRLVLPLRFADEREDAFAELAASLASNVDFAFGQAGYSLNWNDLGDYRMEATDAMRKIGNRYPGIDLACPWTTKYAVAKDGIKCVNWLTFLGPEHVQSLGGADEMARRLGRDVSVRSVSNGLMIQAGPAPETGDINRRLDLPLYRQAGRVLAPVRSRSHPAFLERDGVPSREVTEKWLGRFDR